MTPCLGSQRATTRLLPPGTRDDSAAELAADLGLNLLPWQKEMLGESARMRNGRWSAFEVAALVPRQQGKSFVLVSRALAGCLVYGERLVLYSAHEYRTAAETWRLMQELCDEEGPLGPYVRQIRVTDGKQMVEFDNGCRFKMIARTKTSGRGFSPDCILLDEAFALNGEMMASMLPSLSARPNPQIWYVSSAGTWQSDVLLAMRRRGHVKTTGGLAFWDWYADPADDYRSEKTWAKTNPSYGYLLSRAAVERELESMSLRAFQRERLGIWSESFAETVFDESDVNAVTIDSPQPPRDGRPVGWGVDVDRARTGAAISAAFHGPDGKAVVVLVEERPGAGWVPQRLAELGDLYGSMGVAYDAKGGITDLLDRANREWGVEIMPLKYAEYPAACAAFAQAVADRRMVMGRAPGLIGDAVSATAANVTTGWVWDRKVTTEPIRLISATCARHALDHGSGLAGGSIF